MSGRGLTAAEQRLLKHWDGAPEDLAALVMEIEAAAAREALPSAEEMARALHNNDGCDCEDGLGWCDALAFDVIEAVRKARAARASDGGR